MEDTWVLGIIFVACVLVLILLQNYFTWARGYTDENAQWDHPVIVNDVLTPEECKYIMDAATPLFSPSVVVGSPNTPHPTRTSQTAWISKNDPVARKVFDKVLEATGKSIDNCEDLQVVKYEPGNFYKNHHDSCCDEGQSCIDFEKDGGQRVATLLVYLNSDFTDGETHFPNLDLKLKAKPGSAILFWPLGKNDCRCHPKALHAGLPISSGVKYVCNAWVREERFR